MPTRTATKLSAPLLPGLQILHDRWARLVLVGEAAWLLHLVIGLLQPSLVKIYPLERNLMGGRVDIPFDLAKTLLKFGIHMETGQPASLLYNLYFPALGYYVFCHMLGMTAIAAAVLGRRILFFSCLLPLLIPAAFFGADPGPLASMAVLATALAVGRCVIKREFKMIAPFVAACVLAFCAQTYTAAHAAFRPTIWVTRTPDDSEHARIAALETALSQIRNADGDIAYVRAQIAYIRDDRAALTTIGPIKRANVQTTAFSHHRLRVLNAAIEQIAHPPKPVSVYNVVLRIIDNLLWLPVLILLFLTQRLRWRIGRLTKLAATLQGVPPLRAATG